MSTGLEPSSSVLGVVSTGLEPSSTVTEFAFQPGAEAASSTVTTLRLCQDNVAAAIAQRATCLAGETDRGPVVTSVDDLSGKEVFVRASSSYHQSLLDLNARLVKAGKPPVTITPAPEELEDEDLLEMASAGLVDVLVVDNHKAWFWQRVWPALKLYPTVTLRKGGRIAWAVRKDSPRFKAALDTWASYSTPNGPLFDNAFMLWTSHVAAGPSHSFRNLPIIIAGSPGGYLKQGAYVNGAGNNNKLFNTLANAVGCTSNGAPYDGFGGSGIAQGEISAIRA